MKWRNLTKNGKSKVEVVREAIILLADWAARGRDLGDPVHEWVTEGRRKQYEDAVRRKATWALNMKAGYSSCGDLWHFVLMLLGCRDERIVNRNDDGGLVGWAVGRNLSHVTGLPAFRKRGEPEPGDFLHLQSPDHATILLKKQPALGGASVTEYWTTANYGSPYGAVKAQRVVRREGTGEIYLDGRRVVGFLAVEDIVPMLTNPALLPDGMDVGIETDNPYVDELPVPKGVD